MPPRLRLSLVLSLAVVGLMAGASLAQSATPSSSAADETTPVPIPEPTELAVQYHRTGTALWAFARFWDLAVPLALLCTGASARLRDFARRLGRRWFPTVGIYLVLFVLIVFVAELPLKYYAGFVRQHAYGLSNQTFGKWLWDSIVGIGVDMVGVFCFGWVPFFLIARLPRWWWLAVGVLMAPFAAFVMLIAPVIIDPLFNEFRPLGRDASAADLAVTLSADGQPIDRQALERKILDLATKAGISSARVYEVNKSVDTKAVNAYVKGLFGTHRIVLWDTLLARLDEREILAVMGHELGHYVLGHIRLAILLSCVIVTAGLFWTDRMGRFLIRRCSRRLGFDSLADVAATPLLVSLIAVSALALGPVSLAFSRHQEHEADRFALDLTHMNRSAARAFADLQRENLGVPRHSVLDRIFRSTHPSIADRISFCNEYRPWAAVSTGLATPP